jgi:hypothetical protein
MAIQLLVIAGSFIFLFLGTIHMIYTFNGNKFKARNALVTESMKQTSPVLTKETTMWKAWIGFNGSHSLGAMFFGLENILLSIENPQVFTGSFSLLALDVLVCAAYLWLAIQYWFRIPLTGIAIAMGCFVLAVLLKAL